MELRTHELNIPMIKAALSVYAEVWVHGDGNMYPIFQADPEKPNILDESKNHSECFNKGHEDMSYRVKISRLNIPKNKAELDQMLVTSKLREDAAKKGRTDNRERVTSLRVDDTHYRGNDVVEPAGDIDYTKYVKK